MYGRDRALSVSLFVAALIAWATVVLFLSTRSPRGDPATQLLGAAFLGVAAAITAVPLFWLAVFGSNRRIAYRGDWLRAGRRGAWVGVVVALFVILRAQGAFSLPIALFVIVMIGVVELTLSVER